MSVFDLRSVPAGQVHLHDARRSRNWQVELEAFEIGAVPVTAAQYSQVTGVSDLGGHSPVVNLSWLDAIALCNAASTLDGLTSAYRVDTDESGTGEQGAIEVIWQTDATGYRLPTEAEWEYACRAGTTGPHYATLEAIAWTANDHVERPQDVGLRQPNEFGLHDTLGNVWEWCWDFLDPARYGEYRVFRGGGFADKPWSVRASTRRGGAPGMSHPDVGLRVARGAFSAPDEAQGWSVQADIERGSAVSAGMLPSGWTPRRVAHGSGAPTPL